MNVRRPTRPLSITAMLLAPVTLASLPVQAEITGNIGVVSKYIFRGGGVVGTTTVHENNGAAVQGGLDYAHASGLYAGYWGSSLDYSNGEDTSGFENDVYAGYSGAAGGVSYDLGLLYYYYLAVDDADTPELYGSVGYGPVSVGFAYLMDDVAWGNQGDIYWKLSYETALPDEFTFGATAGYFTYKENGDFITGSESSGLKHVDLSLSHPLGASGAQMSITYMVGGKDRFDKDIEDAVVLGAELTF